MPPIVVVVVDPGGRTHTLTGWSAGLVALVIVNQDQINAAAFGSLTCNFGPTTGVSLGMFQDLGRVKV